MSHDFRGAAGWTALHSVCFGFVGKVPYTYIHFKHSSIHRCIESVTVAVVAWGLCAAEISSDERKGKILRRAGSEPGVRNSEAVIWVRGQIIVIIQYCMTIMSWRLRCLIWTWRSRISREFAVGWLMESGLRTHLLLRAMDALFLTTLSCALSLYGRSSS